MKHVLHVPGQQSKSERDAKKEKKRKHLEKVERRENEKKRKRQEREGKEKYDSKELFKKFADASKFSRCVKISRMGQKRVVGKAKKSDRKSREKAKVPYRIMKGIQRKQIAKKKKYEEEAKAADVVLGKKKKKKREEVCHQRWSKTEAQLLVLLSEGLSCTLYYFQYVILWSITVGILRIFSIYSIIIVD